MSLHWKEPLLKLTSQCFLAFFAVCFSKGYAWYVFPPRLDKNQASAFRSLFSVQLYYGLSRSGADINEDGVFSPSVNKY